MKRYQNGKMIETSKEEFEKIQKVFKPSRNLSRRSMNDFEKRIKTLEESVASILAQLNTDKPSNEEQLTIQKPLLDEGEMK